jgi:hypothetical protein
MKAASLALLALLAAGCAPANPSDPVLYRPADGSFEARVPGDWRVESGASGERRAAFFGPPGGPHPYAEMMRVYFHPGQTPEGYRAAAAPGLPPPLDAAAAPEFTRSSEVPDPHGPTRSVTTRSVLVPASGGLFVLEHSWPSEAAPSGAFAALLASFKPRP